MPIMRFHNREEAQEWNNIIEHFESIMSLAAQEDKRLKEFCDAQLQTAQFWKRYAFERTNDAKLREIASSSLEQVEANITVAESAVPDFLQKMLRFLKQFQPGS